MSRTLIIWFFLLFDISVFSQTGIEWGETVVVNNNLYYMQFRDYLKNQDNHRIKYGSEYGRMLKLDSNTWLSAYTVSENLGYENEENGGFKLEVARSDDNGRTWRKISEISDKGRDLDNGQLINYQMDPFYLAAVQFGGKNPIGFRFIKVQIKDVPGKD